jgi:hypothetical protein
MICLRSVLWAAAGGLVLAALALADAALNPTPPPARPWRALDREALMARFALAGLIIFLCNLGCALLRSVFAPEDDDSEPHGLERPGKPA